MPVSVGVGVVNVDAGTASKWIGRGIMAVAILLVAVIMLAVLAFHRGHEVEVACGPTVSTPLGDQGLNVSGKLGDLMASPDFSSPWQIVKTVFGVIDMLKLWFDNLTSHAQNLPEGSAATGWRRETERQRAAALASCCPTTTPPPDNPDTAPVPPFDPKTLSFQKTGEFTPGQLGIGRTIISVAKAKDVPQRGWIVAFATAFQESGMRNLDYGDRDSLGVFQQRPSQGWGSAAQVQDPKYAAAAFFDHLVKVPGWQTMPVTQAAQAVQRSGFPGAYAKWEDDANRLLAAVGADVAPAPPTTPNLNCPALAGGSGQLDAKVATWNVRRDNSASRIEQGVAALSSAADVIGLQELGDEGRRAVAARAAQGMAMTTAPVAVPILYSTSKYTALTQGAELAFPETRAEPSHGDSGHAGPKWVAFVQLQDQVTGRKFTVVNTHMLVGWQGNPGRTRLYQRQLAKTLQVVDRFQASGDPVLVTGDFNASNVPAMASHGLTSSLTTATHGKRTIDRVYSSGATPTRHDVLSNYGSDHNAVVATFVAAVGGGPVPASFKGNPRTVAQTMAWLQARVDDRTPITPNRCSHYVANAYGWPDSGSPTALSLWGDIPGSKKTPGTSTPPRGALVFWHTSAAAGHIAISAGGGMIYSTDVPTGRWGLVPIAKIDAWGPRVGWSAPYWPAHSGGTQA